MGEEGRQVQVVRAGIDSLYLSYPGTLAKEIDAKLAELKRLAQSREPHENGQAVMEFGGHVLEVMDRGVRWYPYILADNRFWIQLSSADSVRMPLAYVRIASAYLSAVGVDAAEEALHTILSDLGHIADTPTASRADLHVDFVPPGPVVPCAHDAWVTNAGSIKNYWEGPRFSGWTFGLKGPIAARLYDKTLEIEKSGKQYLRELWREAGWDGQSPVWRLEFEFKRDFLNQVGIRGLSQLLSNLASLWAYGTGDWLRLTAPQPGDSNRARWPVDPLWRSLQAVDWGQAPRPLLRTFSAARLPEDGFLWQRCFSVVTTFMASRGITEWNEGVRQLTERTSAFYWALCLKAIGVSFDQLVHEKVAAKARKFNVALPPFRVDRQESADDGLSDAERYRRASDGW